MDIVARARGLIMRPREEWQVIAREPADTAGLFTGYAMPLALIPAVSGLIGSMLLGSMLGGLPGMARIGIGAMLLHTVTAYVLGLVAVWVLGKIVQALAPKSGGVADEVAAMKLAVYSYTATWLAGIFAIIPILAILGLLGLYSLYIFYKGVPVVARVPEDRALGFTLVVILCAILVNILVITIAGLLLF
ncbi:Yip1 family protein [Siccirubricoccus sp. G192]|uniref:Yip1 family protein n=1 Tax=Siccirubricoccus sp. G192 TaxID=2849651 RepID=UPI001C2BC1AE|nr:Yip1 family protein [Siccirubricoccus sp. G192]MBV1795907.1 YIP1 family protein [Siccirubricoccus sp. G192]